jgi:hypothetical protein
MPLTNLNIGAAPNDGTGETLRSGGAKINTNYTFTVTTDTTQTISGAKTFTAATAITSTAQALLSVIGVNSNTGIGQRANYGAIIQLRNTNTTVGALSGLWSVNPADSGSSAIVFQGTGTNNSLTNILFLTAPTVAAPVERMRIASDGKITAGAGTHWVGTVSQNSSSAIVERGSNANGEFVRFADGTQICLKTLTGLGPITSAFGSIFISTTSYSFGTLPASFTAAPRVSISSFSALQSSIVSSLEPATTTNGPSFFLVRGTSGSATDFAAELIAVGRWY